MTKILLVTIDALRYDYSIGRYGRDCMPALSEIAEDGHSYDHAFSTGPGTSTSFPGILGGTLPLDYGYRGLSQQHISLAEVLQQHNIKTIGISGNLATSRVFNYDRGFTHYSDTLNSPIHKRIYEMVKGTNIEPVAKKTLQFKGRLESVFTEEPSVPYKKAEEVSREFKDVVRNEVTKDEDWFGWIHFMDTHNPYSPPKKYIRDKYNGELNLNYVNKLVNEWAKKKPELYSKPDGHFFSDTEIEALKSYYEAEAKYVDSELSKLIGWLDKQNQTEDLFLIVCSDHGEEFFDHGDYAHRPKLYDELIHVPLVIKHFNDRKNESFTENNIVSLVDIPPTVTNIFDVERADNWRGEPLISPEYSRRYAISELSHRSGLGGAVDPNEIIISIRTKKKKYILNNQINKREVYDIHNDKYEYKNLYGSDKIKYEDLVQICEKRLDSITSIESESDLDYKVEDQLENLGYIE